MKKAERQPGDAPKQSEPRPGSLGTAFESPQGEGIARLEARQASSPRLGGLARLAALADASPAAAAQRKLAAGMNDSPRLQTQGRLLQAMARGPGSAIQRVIVKGTTHRSMGQPKLGGTDWYKELPNDDHRAFARALHDEKTKYTKKEAEEEIQARIDRGDPVPDDKKTEKEKRLKRVRDFVNDNAPSSDDESHRRGESLAQASAHAYARHNRKYRKRKNFQRNVDKINAVKPGLFQDQDEVLSGSNDWEQIFALTHGKPQSYDFNLGGDKVTLDSIDFKSNKERSRKRRPGNRKMNLAQVFIEQEGGKNSYWKMADSGDTAMLDGSPHKKLRHLEVEREPQSAFTTYGKDALLEQGRMDAKTAFGDEGFTAFQEYKGALDPTAAMRRMQMGSAHRVLEIALKSANRELGTRVEKHELTSAQQISDALDAYMRDRKSSNYRVLIKEIFRLVRARTGMDIESDTEAEEDYGSDVNDGGK